MTTNGDANDGGLRIHDDLTALATRCRETVERLRRELEQAERLLAGLDIALGRKPEPSQGKSATIKRSIIDLLCTRPGLRLSEIIAGVERTRPGTNRQSVESILGKAVMDGAVVSSGPRRAQRYYCSLVNVSALRDSA